ncbi:type VI secretion system-associated FHA domain protein TagH [uncultured Tateyamaria sp.]|uniref:type VI secretion system-associated FHA domain protein TagH n=1 Tax=uncultured Tateyamaria sp. TaxID=455651 RepID=UPI002613B71D|nr:type VI secretion system-associated FHA domain protein TagH [uncultured Tateyamaria sp.]
MPVVLKFQSTGSIAGNGDPVAMHGASLTIGRGDDNDLVLPDPDRVLSKRHCAIEDHNGNVIVLDISTNGTFLNYGKLPLGATPTPLNNGDILSVGPYEILVEITSADQRDQIADPLADGPVSHGIADAAPSAADLLDAPGDGEDFLDDLLGGREGPVGPGSVDRADPGDDGLLPPLGEDDDILPPAPDPSEGQGASTGMHTPAASDHMSTPRTAAPGNAIPDDWDDLLAPSSPEQAEVSEDPFAKPAAGGGGGPAFIPDDFGGDARQEARAPEPPAPAPAPTPAPAPEPTADPSSTAAATDAAARAFLKSLGADEVEIQEQDLTSTLSRMGHVLRIMIEGMREILMTRTSIKSEFRIEQTMIQAGGNNPLKFSVSPEQAIVAMVKPKAKGYLDATEATAQALQDIKAHEVAMITGMEAALKGVLARLDPAILEDKITSGGGLGGLLKSKKARYWEIYEEMYSDISDQAENDFHKLFAQEFARAYQEQLHKLK